MRNLCLAAVGILTLAGGAEAQIVPDTPPPSTAAPVPESAAEANTRAIPGAPITRIERATNPGEPDTIVTIYPGNLEPPPPAAFNRAYPPCSETLQDSCRNPGSTDEAGESPPEDAEPRLTR